MFGEIFILIEGKFREGNNREKALRRGFSVEDSYYKRKGPSDSGAGGDR